jgi:signal transduction histidine kinase
MLLVAWGTPRVLFVNEAARAVNLAQQPQENACFFVGHDQQKLPDDQWPVARLARGQRLDGEDFHWQTPAGTASFLVYSAQYPANPDAVGVLAFVDITSLRRIEEGLRHDLRAREEFFSLATHELKDPLFSLQLSLDVVQRKLEKEGQVSETDLFRHLEVSRRQTDRLTRLVDNLLDMSRIENKRLHLDMELFDLCEMIHDITNRFQEASRLAGSKLKMESCEPVVGYWDKAKMEQVLSNLLANAIKFGAGQPVTVRLFASEADAVLEVQDQGIGIAKSHQHRIFNRFERMATGQAKQSLGLGLYIVRSLVEAHGGSVGVLSDEGRGALFTVTVPRRRMPL